MTKKDVQRKETLEISRILVGEFIQEKTLEKHRVSKGTEWTELKAFSIACLLSAERKRLSSTMSDDW